jgi:8-oxo-dGTP diphosphatase
VKNTRDRLYPDRPIIGCLAVVRRGGRVLLAQRSVPPGIGRWGFPGGLQELGETAHQCAQRELKEETGIDADPLDTIGVLDSLLHDEVGKVQVHFTLVVVLLDWRSGEGEPIEDATALGWFTREEAGALALFPNVEALMEKALGFS